MEGVNGWVRDLPSRPGYFIGTMVEEGLEMAACVLAGAALLRMVDVGTRAGAITIAPGVTTEADSDPSH